MRRHRPEFPHHVLEGMEAVVVKHVDTAEPGEQLRELLRGVACGVLPAGHQVGPHEEVMRGLTRLVAEIDAAEPPMAVRRECRQDVATRGAVEYSRLHHRLRLGRTNEHVQRLEMKVAARTHSGVACDRVELLQPLPVPPGVARLAVFLQQQPRVHLPDP